MEQKKVIQLCAVVGFSLTPFFTIMTVLKSFFFNYFHAY